MSKLIKPGSLCHYWKNAWKGKRRMKPIVPAFTAAPKKENQVEISTLGRFMIKRGDVILSDSLHRSRKVWELFKFLMTNRHRAALPEEALETLWPEQDYGNPNLAMRSLIFRLRRLLEQIGVPDLASGIVYAQGCYRWAAKPGCRLDIEEFEVLCREAGPLARTNPPGAIDRYRRAIAFYRGDFLPECSFCDWVVPARSYYRRLYLESLLKLAALLKEARRFTELIEICEAALLNEYFEEEIHVCYLEALLEEGMHKRAGAHYKEVTAAFYREMGVKLSPALQDIRRWIRDDHGGGGAAADLEIIQAELECRRDAGGAYFCDRDNFRFFYQLERARIERTGRAVFLGSLTLVPRAGEELSPGALAGAADRLQDIVQSNLRKGDVVTRWSETRFILLLPDLRAEQADIVFKRIKDKYRAAAEGEKTVIYCEGRPIVPPSLSGENRLT